MENTQTLPVDDVKRLLAIEEKMKHQRALGAARYKKWMNKDENRAAMKAYKKQYDLNHRQAKQATQATQATA